MCPNPACQSIVPRSLCACSVSPAHHRPGGVSPHRNRTRGNRGKQSDLWRATRETPWPLPGPPPKAPVGQRVTCESQPFTHCRKIGDHRFDVQQGLPQPDFEGGKVPGIKGVELRIEDCSRWVRLTTHHVVREKSRLRAVGAQGDEDAVRHERAVISHNEDRSVIGGNPGLDLQRNAVRILPAQQPLEGRTRDFINRGVTALQMLRGIRSQSVLIAIDCSASRPFCGARGTGWLGFPTMTLPLVGCTTDCRPSTSLAQGSGFAARPRPAHVAGRAQRLADTREARQY